MAREHMRLDLKLIKRAKTMGFQYLPINKTDPQQVSRELKTPPEKILAWRRKEDVIVEEVAELDIYDYVLVNENEIFAYQTTYETLILPKGLWRITNQAKEKPARKTYYIYTGEITLKWGIPRGAGVTLADNYSIGASGEITITITNPEKILKKIPETKKKVTTEDLREKIKTEIITAMRKTLEKTEPTSLKPQKTQEAILNELKTKELGVEITNFKILYMTQPTKTKKSEEEIVIELD